MKIGAFSHRLQTVMRDGNLTGADLARWFDRPDPTVRGWISGDHDLGGAQLDVAFVEAQLVKLEKLLKKNRLKNRMEDLLKIPWKDYTVFGEERQNLKNLQKDLNL